MQIPAQITAVIFVIAAQVYILFRQLDAGGLDDAWSIVEILQWQILGQVAATAVAPDGFRFIALALSSYLAAILAIVIVPAWITMVYPVMTIIAWSNGHPSLAITFVGLTLYIAASVGAVRLLLEAEV